MIQTCKSQNKVTSLQDGTPNQQTFSEFNMQKEITDCCYITLLAQLTGNYLLLHLQLLLSKIDNGPFLLILLPVDISKFNDDYYSPSLTGKLKCKLKKIHESRRLELEETFQ